MNIKEPKLKNCPFCGFNFNNDLDDFRDVIYPVGAWAWDYHHGKKYKKYIKLNTSKRDGWVWGVHCTENMGGCGAQVTANSEEKAIKLWNTRKK